MKARKSYFAKWGLLIEGLGWGSVGRAVSSKTRGPRFEKTNRNQKDVGKGPENNFVDP